MRALRVGLVCLVVVVIAGAVSELDRAGLGDAFRRTGLAGP